MVKLSILKLCISISVALICISAVNAMVGGTTTTVATYKHVCCMRDYGKFICNLILLAKSFGITTCTCASLITDKTKAMATCGTSNLNTAGIKSEIAEIYCFPGRTLTNGYPNLAVIKFLNPIEGTNITPIPISTGTDVMFPSRLVGFSGVKDKPNPILDMQFIDLLTGNETQCASEYTGYNKTHMACMSNPSKGVCNPPAQGIGGINNAMLQTMTTDNEPHCDQTKPSNHLKINSPFVLDFIKSKVTFD